jgi:phosphate transport system substrate-binding protein
MFNKKTVALSLVLLLTLGVVFTMTGQTNAGWWFFGGDDKAEEQLKGKVKVDGSSTVYPITEAVAEEFMKANPRARVSVAYSGTGGGFKKFVVEETDINDASRKVKAEERERAEANGIEMMRFTVAYDGISVVRNPENDWAKDLSTEQLKQIWEPGSDVEQWSDINSDWPDTEIKLYGPGSDSGTFDYFTHAINGEGGAIRPDFTPSENDNVLVRGVAGNKGALGYFGYAYYQENKDKLDVVAVDGVEPSMETIGDESYTPLARPLFIYVNKASLQNPTVKAFLKSYMNNARKLVPQTGYAPLTEEMYQENIDRIEAATK